VMPNKDGREACRRLREISDVPIVMLTCLPGEKEKVERLAEGADDYVTKPFHNAELVARIRAILRRTRRHSDPGFRQYDDGYLKIELDVRSVHVNGAPIALSPIEWRLLECFLRHKNRAIQRHTLLRFAWGDGFDQDINYLKVYVSHLRRKLGDPAQHPRYIHTVRNLGYRFETHN
jgi:DNA-binding response OmpR family regulator